MQLYSLLHIYHKNCKKKQHKYLISLLRREHIVILYKEKKKHGDLLYI